jgi:predicted alpha/beta superfamily hydrolase
VSGVAVRICLALSFLPLSACSPATAEDQQILGHIKAFFETTDADSRAGLVQRIQSDPAYDRGRVAECLSRVELFDELGPGRKKITVQPPVGEVRSVTLRIPEEYSPTKEYPLLYVLHCGGCNAAWSVRFAEQMLGRDINRFVVAAPQGYAAPDSRPYEAFPVLLAIKKLLRIDSDRVYVTGYSAGACTSWAHAILQPDEFAAIVPVAGSLYIGKQTDDFLPNLVNTHVLNVWGAKDTASGWEGDAGGGIAASNRRLRVKVDDLELPVVSVEDPEKGHIGVQPPRKQLMAALRRQRERHPRRVHHMFQHACQARAYWLERNIREDEAWPNYPKPVDRQPDESVNDAIARALATQVAELHGEVDGQTITVAGKNVEEMTLWIGEGMIDWQKPVRVVTEGVEVFHGVLEPDLFVCLTQAARTYDFDRLRWAGLTIRGTEPARAVTGRTPFHAPRP